MKNNWSHLIQNRTPKQRPELQRPTQSQPCSPSLNQVTPFMPRSFCPIPRPTSPLISAASSLAHPLLPGRSNRAVTAARAVSTRAAELTPARAASGRATPPHKGARTADRDGPEWLGNESIAAQRRGSGSAARRADRRGSLGTNRHTHTRGSRRGERPPRLPARHRPTGAGRPQLRFGSGSCLHIYSAIVH